MAYHANSFNDKIETCRSLARFTTNAAALRVLQLLIEEYSAKAEAHKSNLLVPTA